MTKETELRPPPPPLFFISPFPSPIPPTHFKEYKHEQKMKEIPL